MRSKVRVAKRTLLRFYTKDRSIVFHFKKKKEETVKITRGIRNLPATLSACKHNCCSLMWMNRKRKGLCSWIHFLHDLHFWVTTYASLFRRVYIVGPVQEDNAMICLVSDTSNNVEMKQCAEITLLSLVSAVVQLKSAFNIHCNSPHVHEERHYKSNVQQRLSPVVFTWALAMQYMFNVDINFLNTHSYNNLI